MLEKYCTAGQAIDGNIARSMRNACWIHKAKDTQSEYVVDCVWNVMAHVQKPYFFFRRNGRVHLNRQGASVQSTIGSRLVRIRGSNAGYNMFRGSLKRLLNAVHPDVFFEFTKYKNYLV